MCFGKSGTVRSNTAVLDVVGRDEGMTDDTTGGGMLQRSEENGHRITRGTWDVLGSRGAGETAAPPSSASETRSKILNARQLA